MKRISVCEPMLGGNELRYVEDAIRSTWIAASGEYLRRFREGFASYVGRRFADTTPNGTTALHLALRALDIGPGDEVIVPSFTIISCANAVCYCGAMPVFVDCEPRTWTIDVEQIEAKITPRTRAIMAVHLYGHPCDLDPLLAIAAKHGLHVIEDAAQAIGSRYRDKPCGSFGVISCFSLFANKLITTGEGGMVVTDDEAFYERVRYLKNLAFSPQGPRDFRHEEIGFNYRTTNVLAAIGLAQLERVDDYLAARRRNAARYTQRLARLPGLRLPIEEQWAHSSYWMYALEVDPDVWGMDRDTLMDRLLDEYGVETRRFFLGLHAQPCLQNYGCDCSGTYPVADRIAQTGLYLPSGSGLTEEDQDRVIAALEALSPT